MLARLTGRTPEPIAPTGRPHLLSGGSITLAFNGPRRRRSRTGSADPGANAASDRDGGATHIGIAPVLHLECALRFGDSRDSGGPRHGCGATGLVPEGEASAGSPELSRDYCSCLDPEPAADLADTSASPVRWQRASKHPMRGVGDEVARQLKINQRGGCRSQHGLRRQRPRRRARRLTSPHAKACEQSMCDEVHACWRRSSSPRGSADGRTQLAYPDKAPAARAGRPALDRRLPGVTVAVPTSSSRA